jgi:hypothetical protein
MSFPFTRQDAPWGRMWLLWRCKRGWVKIIHVDPGERTSLQHHFLRSELHLGLTVWRCRIIEKGEEHRLRAGWYLEIAWGEEMLEDDIIRITDDYGRED